MSKHNTPDRNGSENGSPRRYKIFPVQVFLTNGTFYVLPLSLINPRVLPRRVVHQVEPEQDPDQAGPSCNIEDCLPSQTVSNITRQSENNKCTNAGTRDIYTIKPAWLQSRTCYIIRSMTY